MWEFASIAPALTLGLSSHTHTQTYIHAHTPSFLTHSASSLPLLLPLPPSLLPPSLCRVYSPSILLGALLQSAHTLTPYCSHFSVFLFSLSLFPFLILALSLTALPFPLPTLGSHTHRPKPIVAYYFITCPAHLITAILIDRASTISKITPEMKKSLT